MKRQLIIIKTCDSKKEYQYEIGVKNNNPNLWKISIEINPVDEQTGLAPRLIYQEAKEIFVERETLINAGLVGERTEIKEGKENQETLEDLILRILEFVRVFPEE